MNARTRSLSAIAVSALFATGVVGPLFVQPAVAATPTDLLISEYVEGSSNNKAIEIYNGTGAAVNLSAYELAYYFNGSSSAGLTIPLGGSVAAGDVFVVAHSSAAPAILSEADQTNGAGWFNGDDAIVLSKGATVVDSLGQVGFDPGSQWGTGLLSTQDNTLRRKTPTSRDTNITDAFDPSQNWVGFAPDTFDGLGSSDPIDEIPGGSTDPDPEPGVVKIGAVQGAGAASPLNGQTVVVEGIVTGDFQAGGLGFYVQDSGDDDAKTSDGISVFHTATPVAPGDQVTVKGKVAEFNGLTQLGNATVTVVSSGHELPAPVDLSLPIAGHEAYESMLVTLPQTLTINEYFNYDRFGEIVLGTSRQDTPTAVVEPGADAQELAEWNLRNRITLDDGRSSQNPTPAIHPNGQEFSQTNYFRGGDTLTNVTGILDHRFDLWRIQPTQGAEYASVNPRPAVPNVGGSIQVASFNVLNYFTTLTSEDNNARGADTAEEFARQEAKIVAALAEMDAEVVGLIEIENNSTAVQTLVDALNVKAGAGTYEAIITGPLGTDAITTALIYQPAEVTPFKKFAVLDYGDELNRPTLLQTFRDNDTNVRFSVAVNHLKSKGSDCNDVNDPDTGDGSGNCNATRTAAAQKMAEWIATDPVHSNAAYSLVIGDLNAYDHEDPMDAFEAAGYTDFIKKFTGESVETGAYSYVFDGQNGYLDHSLGMAEKVVATKNTEEIITGATPWHINADEVDLFDYDMSFKKQNEINLFAPNAYRSSDHDPILIGLDPTQAKTEGWRKAQERKAEAEAQKAERQNR